MKTIACVFAVAVAAVSGQQPEAGKDASKRPEITNSIGMKLMLIPAGKFVMGSPRYQAREEKPHPVRITRPFFLGVFEVTQKEYQEVMGINPSAFNQKTVGMDTSRFPAEAQWEQAVNFCKKLSELPGEKKAGRVYRLPTEAEWEYACRAGTTTETAFGDGLSALQANFNGNAPYGDAPKGPHLKRPTHVGSYQPNAFGLHDMHGNLWEWCSDWLDDDYYSRAPVDDPKGPESGKYRVVRGGGYFYTGEHCRSATRSHPIRAGIGFRVACDQQGKEQESP